MLLSCLVLLALHGCMARLGDEGDIKVRYPVNSRKLTTTVITESDLPEYKLVFSFDTSPINIPVFFIDIKTTDGGLTDNSIQLLEDAVGIFVKNVLKNQFYELDRIKQVNTSITNQTALRNSAGPYGSSLETKVSVTFRTRPCPTSEKVASKLAELTKDPAKMSDFVKIIISLATERHDQELLGVTFAMFRAPSSNDPNGSQGGPTSVGGENGSTNATVATVVPTAAASALLVAGLLFLVLRSRNSKNENPDVPSNLNRKVNVVADDEESDIFSVEAALVESPSGSESMTHSSNESSKSDIGLIEIDSDSSYTTGTGGSVFQYFGRDNAPTLGIRKIKRIQGTKTRNSKMFTTPAKMSSILQIFSEEEDEDLMSDEEECESLTSGSAQGTPSPNQPYESITLDQLLVEKYSSHEDVDLVSPVHVSPASVFRNGHQANNKSLEVVTNSDQRTTRSTNPPSLYGQSPSRRSPLTSPRPPLYKSSPRGKNVVTATTTQKSLANSNVLQGSPDIWSNATSPIGPPKTVTKSPGIETSGVVPTKTGTSSKLDSPQKSTNARPESPLVETWRQKPSPKLANSPVVGGSQSQFSSNSLLEGPLSLDEQSLQIRIGSRAGINATSEIQEQRDDITETLGSRHFEFRASEEMDSSTKARTPIEHDGATEIQRRDMAKRMSTRVSGQRVEIDSEGAHDPSSRVVKSLSPAKTTDLRSFLHQTAACYAFPLRSVRSESPTNKVKATKKTDLRSILSQTAGLQACDPCADSSACLETPTSQVNKRSGKHPPAEVWNQPLFSQEREDRSGVPRRSENLMADQSAAKARSVSPQKSDVQIPTIQFSKSDVTDKNARGRSEKASNLPPLVTSAVDVAKPQVGTKSIETSPSKRVSHEAVLHPTAAPEKSSNVAKSVQASPGEGMSNLTDGSDKWSFQSVVEAAAIAASSVGLTFGEPLRIRRIDTYEDILSEVGSGFSDPSINGPMGSEDSLQGPGLVDSRSFSPVTASSPSRNDGNGRDSEGQPNESSSPGWLSRTRARIARSISPKSFSLAPGNDKGSQKEIGSKRARTSLELSDWKTKANEIDAKDKQGSARFFPEGRHHARYSAVDGSTDYQEMLQHRDGNMSSFDAVSLSDSNGSDLLDTTPPSNKTNQFVHSPTSGEDDSALEGQRRQKLLTDLVWLEKKIAGQKLPVGQHPSSPFSLDSTYYAGTPEMSHAHNNGKLSRNDSLSFTSVDGHVESETESVGQDGDNTAMSSIVCRDCYAPPGKLRIVIHSTKDGPAVHTVKKGSSLEGHLFPGDLIVSVDDQDTRAYTAEHVMRLMASRSNQERKITVLHFEKESPTGFKRQRKS